MLSPSVGLDKRSVTINQPFTCCINLNGGCDGNPYKQTTKTQHFESWNLPFEKKNIIFQHLHVWVQHVNFSRGVYKIWKMQNIDKKHLTQKWDNQPLFPSDFLRIRSFWWRSNKPNQLIHRQAFSRCVFRCSFRSQDVLQFCFPECKMDHQCPYIVGRG